MHPARGFTLLEVVIVVTILALIATLSFQNLLQALDRGRHASTLGDMREIAGALERFAVDHQSYPVVPDIESLRPALEPEYLKQLPLRDGWHHPLVYEVEDPGSTYTLRSPGKDGTFQSGTSQDGTPPDAAGYAADIVCTDGVFRQPDQQPEPGSDPGKGVTSGGSGTGP